MPARRPRDEFRPFRRHRPRRLVAAAAVLALGLIAASPVQDVPSSSQGSDAQGSLEEARADALARLESAGSVLDTPTLSAAVAAAARLDDVAITLPAVPEPAALPEGVPQGLAGPVGRLLAAVEVAESYARASLRTDVATIDRLIHEAERLLALEEIPSETSQRLAERIEGSVDRRAQLTGAAVLARALDTELPRLRAYAATLPPSSERVEGCDLTDAPPALCIGGMGSNEYAEDYALLIDLGGNDVYANSAGGADPTVNGLAVSVAVDISGDDTYLTPDPASDSWFLQGGGARGGIGVLLDAAGNDTYTVDGLPDVAWIDHLWGQGGGSAGVGILADLGGDDRYVLSNVGSTDEAPNTYGQGYGVAGVGILLDADGNDSYSVSSTPDPQADQALTFGLGAGGVGGIGLLIDGGGNDSFSMVATVDSPAPNTRDRAYVLAGGWSSIGVGVAALGPGDSSWEVEARADAGGHALAEGLGAATAGFAGLLDLGGDDTYTLEARSEAIDSRSCECNGLASDARTVGATTRGLGYGLSGGVGLLLDAGGNDRYRASAVSRAVAEAHDLRTEGAIPELGGFVARAVAGSAELTALGASGRPFVETGAGGLGLLHDLLGDDTYEARAVSESSASASSAVSETPPVSTARSSDAVATAYGAAITGYAELLDLGGEDSYLSLSASEATADSPPGATPGIASSSVAGSVERNAIARFVDVDGGASDHFDFTPEDPACEGTRGEGLWVDCGQVLGFGVNQ